MLPRKQPEGVSLKGSMDVNPDLWVTPNLQKLGPDGPSIPSSGELGLYLPGKLTNLGRNRSNGSGS